MWTAPSPLSSPHILHILQQDTLRISITKTMIINQNLLLKYFYYLFMIHYFFQTSYGNQNPHCPPSSCGHIHNISHPFRLRDDPKHCGDFMYELSCEKNTTLVLHFNLRKYVVQAINYHNYTIRLRDPTIKNNTCSFPRRSLSPDFFSLGFYYTTKSYKDSSNITRSITFMSCPYRVSNSVHLLEITECFKESSYRRFTYVKFGDLNGSYVKDMCKIEAMVMTSLPIKDENSVSLSEIHSSLVYGFELSWFVALCDGKCVDCAFDGKKATCESFHFVRLLFFKLVLPLFGTGFLVLILAIRILIVIPCMLGLLYCKLRRRHFSMFNIIESFLQSNNNLMPIRYSYSDIKKITGVFRKKLGEGGYGSVYKGKLRSGFDVAVKVLGKARSNGQDFINEVATIGRIHHVNVVKLVGYCAERSKSALVYDFMPNGSLDKYILDQERGNSLSWEKRYDIAIGVARGIEYLHKGCNIQILHFDIKPHNILLDDNFTPKVSDFGLAKFYSTEKTAVTLTAARGTIGYVAPELVNRSIGEVSYKADVYSFGMLLMAMVGLKEDTAVANDDESSKYFPYWIYDRLNKGKDIEIGNTDEDDDEYVRKITRKMTIVGLWCIQTSPSDRPSMSEVIKLLEGDGENLQVPPMRPSQSPQIAQSHYVQTWGTETTDSIVLLDDVSDDE